MARDFGELRAYFYELDDVVSGTPVSIDGSAILTDIVPDTVEWTRAASQVGSGRVSLMWNARSRDFAVLGRVCVVEQMVSGYGGMFSRLMSVFLIDEIEPKTNSDGAGILEIRGPGVEHLLTRYAVFDPVGEETIINTTLDENAPGPLSRTLDGAAIAMSNTVKLNSAANIEVTDELRIQDNGGGWHVFEVVAVEPGGATGVVQFVPALGTACSSGNAVSIRRKAVEVADVAGLGVGQKVELTLNSGTHISRIADLNESAKVVTLANGVPSAANSGKAFKAYDYSKPATNDVSQILQHAGDWGATFETGNGTAMGTAHVPKGESAFDLLMSTAERTGEFFRYRVTESNIPTFSIQWRRTPDSSGVTLRMYTATGVYGLSQQLTDESNKNIGAIFSMQKRTTTGMVTRLYPSSGNQKISLKYCSNAALSYATTKGCYVTLSSDIYEPDSVTYSAGADAYGVLTQRETFGDITIDESATFNELRAASDQLLISAIHYLLDMHTRDMYVVEAYVPVTLKPGQSVKIYNSTDAIPTIADNADYVILDISDKTRNGRPVTTMTVSPTMGLKRTAANTFATTIKSVTRSVRRIGGDTTKSTTVIVNPGGDGGGGGGGDGHTHSQYVPVVGGVTLTGNIGAAAGVTIDGVDISAHASNADAHHAAVTVSNTGLSLSGQAVGLRVSSAGGLFIDGDGAAMKLAAPSGLTKTIDGLAIADTLAGDGLQMASKVLKVGLASPSGLTFSGGLLKMGTPGTVSAVSVSGVTVTGHSHDVDASSNPGAATRLLKTDATGYLQLFAAGISTPPDGASGLAVMAPANNWHALKIKQRMGQTAHMLRIEDSGGGALILLTNDGRLESGRPGYVSGVTGWQIAPNGDAEFNNLRVRGELHATTFVADEMHATGGTLLIATATTAGRGTAAGDDSGGTMGALDGVGTSTLFATASYMTGMSYFAVGDIVRVKAMGRTANGQSLHIPDIYLEVTTIGALYDRNMSQGIPGYYKMTCTRRSGAFTGYKVPPGSAIVKWTGTSSANTPPVEHSAYKGQMLLTSDLSQSPYVDVFTVDATRLRGNKAGASWPGSGDIRTPPGIKPRVRLGNLDGVLGLPEQWGLAAGTDLSDTSLSAKYFVASNLGFKMQNINIEMYNGGQRSIDISTNGLEFTATDSGIYFEGSRVIRWKTSGGTTVGGIGVMTNGSQRYMSIGLDFPTPQELMDFGIGLMFDKTLSWGDPLNAIEIWGGGRINLDATNVYAGGRFWAGETKTGKLSSTGGLILGNTNHATTQPDTGIVRLAMRTQYASQYPPSGFADLYIEHSMSGDQVLYIRFSNGVTRQLAKSS